MEGDPQRWNCRSVLNNTCPAMASCVVRATTTATAALVMMMVMTLAMVVVVFVLLLLLS